QVFDVIGQVEAGTMDAGRARGVINEMTMRQNDWALGAYCQSYCRLVATHHTIESSSMFPHLRRSEPGLGPVLDRLDEEHHTIHGLLEDVDRALVAVVSGTDALPGLRVAVERLAERLTAHLSYEEEQLVGPLDRHGFY
ncbi:hemerythrin domain-containing protein, partial [Actinosynnema sp.]|uniref:hemerythrin domain-containing protein n=1 Tax=Actinosynnema sp. TaxID=1872144 RepID=UPI003F83EE7D